MGIGRTTRDAIAIFLIALACAGLATSPWLEKIRGISIDVLTLARWQLFETRHDPAASPTVVVAIDEETYETPPFKGSPTLTWTGEIARVLPAITEGGAKVIGFDMVFPTSIEQSEIPFGEGVFGEKVRGFDRDFLRALAGGAASGKVVLGEVLRGDKPILPSPGQRIAVRQQQNIRPLNIYTDSDDVIRRVPLTFRIDGKPVPGMALELAARALGQRPEIGDNGSVTLAGYRVPQNIDNTLTLNFEGGADDIPTYSFADLALCARNGDKDYFRREFADKIVIFGTVMDSEDRQLTSKRFATRTEGARRPRCANGEKAAPGRFERAKIAGIYIHATAVNNLMRKDAVTEQRQGVVFAIATVLALLAAGSAWLFRPVGAAAATLVLFGLWTLFATVLFRHSLVLPLAEPATAGALALASAIGYRFISSDKERRLLQKGFSLYLAPDVIDKMLSSNKLPQLGGETREVTMLFSDIEGFSQIAEQLSPDALMAVTNAYLSAMTEVIESCGGYVDKYIGDSVVAMFGAPVDDPDHAASAARAALGCSRKLAELNAAGAFHGYAMRQRIGINTGPALVGNFGSHRRFNYSVMSDAVNLASRLEGANKFYGSTIMASELTVAEAGNAFAWRELDTIRVKGRGQALRIYELMATQDDLTVPQREAMTAYAEGLAAWRAGQFASAASSFDRVADTDRPSAMFRDRAREAMASGPAADWDPVRTLQEK